MTTIYDLCVEKSKAEREVYLPNGNCELTNIRRHHLDETVLIVTFFQKPGFCKDDPISIGRSLSDEVEFIEYVHRGKPHERARVSLKLEKKIKLLYKS
jgi:hypothetical protein